MLSKVAKVLFPLSLFVYMFLVTLDVATSKIGLLAILPPPQTGVVLVVLLVANVIYLLTFVRPCLVERILMAVCAPIAMFAGSTLLSRAAVWDAQRDITACLFSGVVFLVGAIVLYFLAYEGDRKQRGSHEDLS